MHHPSIYYPLNVRITLLEDDFKVILSVFNVVIEQIVLSVAWVSRKRIEQLLFIGVLSVVILIHIFYEFYMYNGRPL